MGVRAWVGYRWKALRELFRSNRVPIEVTGVPEKLCFAESREGDSATLRAVTRPPGRRSASRSRSLALLVRAWNPVAIGTRADPEHPRAAMPSLIHSSRPPTRNIPAPTAGIALLACPCRIFNETDRTVHQAPTSTCTSWSQVLTFTRSAHFRPGPPQYPSALSACAPQNWADDLAGLYAFLYLSQAGRIMLWLLLTKLELLLTTLGLLLAVSLVLRLQC